MQRLKRLPRGRVVERKSFSFQVPEVADFKLRNHPTGNSRSGPPQKLRRPRHGSRRRDSPLPSNSDAAVEAAARC